MALELRDYLLTDAGVAIPSWTVNLRTGRKTGAAGSILFSTTTDANGMWEFVDGSGGVTLVGGTKYDVQATNGTSERWWRGYTAIPQSFTDLQIADNAAIQYGKLDIGLRGPPNALTNGDFTVWQRGTSFAAAANAAYTADRWQWTFAGTGVVTVARDTAVPTAGANAISTPYALKTTVTTADAAIAAADLYALLQTVEGFDYRALANGMALSFWVKAHRTGTYCVAALAGGNDGHYIAEYTVAAADTWEYQTVVIPAPSVGTFGLTTGAGLTLYFAVAAGSNYQAAAASWAAGVKLATSNQVNGVAATSDVFSLALVNLVPGSAAVPMAPLPAAVQFERCQRYCQVFGGNNTNEYVGTGTATNATTASIVVPFPTTMAGVPTASVSAASDWEIAGNAIVTATAVVFAVLGPSSAGLAVSVAAGLTAGQGALLRAHGTTNARMTFESNPA